MPTVYTPTEGLTGYDLFRIVTLGYGGRPVEVMDLNDGETFARERDTFTYTPAASTSQIARSGRRYGAARVARVVHTESGSVAWRAIVKGTSPDSAALEVERLLAEIEDAAQNRMLEWRPDGMSLSKSSFFKVTGPGTWSGQYQSVAMREGIIRADITFPVAPLVEWAPMTVRDNFAVDSRSDYTFVQGDGTATYGLDAAMGNYMGISSTAVKQFYHTGRGYKYSDVAVALKFTTGSTVAGAIVDVNLRRLGLSDRLIARFTGTTLSIRQVLAGVETQRTSSVYGSGLSANNDYWLVFIADGVNLKALFWAVGDPTPLGFPGANGALTSSNLGDGGGTAVDVFGWGVEGDVGVTLTAPDTGWRINEFQALPYFYHDQTLPDVIELPEVPGNAPAKCDLSVTASGGAAAPVFGLVGWTSRLEQFNYVVNPGGEVNTGGWSGVNADYLAGTSTVSRVTTASKFGSASVNVVTPATSGAGVAFDFTGSFRGGRPLDFEVWVRSASQTTSVNARLRGWGGDDTAGNGTSLNLSSTWQRLTGRWYPDGLSTRAVLTVATNAATATTFQVDGARVWLAGDAPRLTSQTGDQSGVPPFGIFGTSGASDSSGMAMFENPVFRDGEGLGDTSVSGAETYTVAWLVDPNTLAEDAFTDGELSVEWWGRFHMTPGLVTPKVILSTRPIDGTNFGAERFTDEYGNVGKLLKPPSSGTGSQRFVRLGTLTFPVNPTNPRAQKVWLTAVMGGGSSGEFLIDYLVAVPIRNRASSPTNKPLDVAYPKFISSILETTKIVYSDLSGGVAKPPFNPYPDHGLGGSVLEIPTGTVSTLIKVSSMVPDDPTLTGTSEQLLHNATVQYAITPRSFMLRGE